VVLTETAIGCAEHSKFAILCSVVVDVVVEVPAIVVGPSFSQSIVPQYHHLHLHPQNHDTAPAHHHCPTNHTDRFPPASPLVIFHRHV